MTKTTYQTSNLFYPTPSTIQPYGCILNQVNALTRHDQQPISPIVLQELNGLPGYRTKRMSRLTGQSIISGSVWKYTSETANIGKHRTPCDRTVPTFAASSAESNPQVRLRGSTRFPVNGFTYF
jgi:hypothetical protein